MYDFTFEEDRNRDWGVGDTQDLREDARRLTKLRRAQLKRKAKEKKEGQEEECES